MQDACGGTTGNAKRKGKTVMPEDTTCRMELLPALIRFLEDNRLLNFNDFRFNTRLKIS